MFQEFDEYLSSTFSVDYWSDEGIGIAEEKLADFSDGDWEQLGIASDNRGSLWLTRCAEVLGDHEESLSVQLLMKLARNSDVEVQIAALDSMNSLLNLVSVEDGVLGELKSIVGQIDASSIVVKTMLDSLKGKIS